MVILSKDTKSFARLFQKRMVLITSIVILVIGTFWLTEEYFRLDNETTKHYQQSTSLLKRNVKDEVLKIAKLINHTKSRTESHLKAEIREITYQAHAIATNLYAEHHKSKTDKQIAKIIIDALRPIRFNKNRGYIFATSLSGVVQLIADKPHLEGMNFLDLQGPSDNYLITRDMIGIVKKQKEGFYKYTWSKPGSQKRDFHKMAFVKFFKPLNWFIGTGEYLDDAAQELQAEALELVGNARHGETGYFFIHSFSGINLSHIDQNIVGEDVSGLQDSNGVKFIDELTKLSRESGGGYLRYIGHFDPRTGEPGEKISYAISIPDWEWVVGSGIYIDQLTTLKKEQHALFTKKIPGKVLKIVLVLLVALLVVYWFVYNISARFTRNFLIFEKFFSEVATQDKLVQVEKLEFIEFKALGIAANTMLQQRQETEVEKINLEKQLRQAQKMEAIGLMAGGVAHDLNNILSGIIGYPELILLDLQKDSKLRKPIEAIQESGTRAAAIVADLLTVARGVASAKRQHDFNVMVHEYLASPEHKKLSLQYPNVLCQQKLEAIKTTINCSDVHVKKCFMNLMANAYEAIAEDGVISISTRNIHIDVEENSMQKLATGNYLLLSVEDSGSGILEEDMLHIFEPFYSQKVMGRSGTGLGLTVVWNTMEDHGGRVSVESSIKGTCFQLYFPVDVKEDTKQVDSSAIQDITGNGEHILVVDDELHLREIGRQMLQSLGYKVDVAVSGEQAILIVKDTKFDIIVLDMLMVPGINGLQTYREILKLHPEQRAIVASGFSEGEDVKATIQLGANEFIKKPYTIDTLGRAVKVALNN